MLRPSLLSAALFFLLALPFGPPGAAAEEADAVARATEAADAGRYGEAIDTLRAALDAAPDDARILLALGSVSERQAREALAGTDATVGRLGLVDALAWYRKARRADPDSAAAAAGVGRVALDLGDFRTAEAAWAAAAKLAPESGEARFGHGYALFLDGRDEEAIRAFDAAEDLLGKDPRILLDRGIAEARTGASAAADEDLLAVIRNEADADRRSSKTMRQALLWLWRNHANHREFAKVEAVFSALAKEYPDLQAAPWYVAHARLERGDAAGAAAQFARVTELSPGWPEGWRQYGRALVKAGDLDRAVGALDHGFALDPEGDTTRALLSDVIDAMRAADRIPDAIALLERLDSKFPGDSLLLERRGDLRFESGDAEGALADWEAAVAAAPFAHEAKVKAEKAATILLRAGTAPEHYLTERFAARPAPPGPAGTILDFESPGIFPRVGGRATWRREDGAMRLIREGEAAGPANLSVTFLPTLDFRPFVSIRFRVRGEAGRALVLGLRDARDPLTAPEGAATLYAPSPIELTGEWQTVTVPCFDFAPATGEGRGPLLPSRVRAIVFEIGRAPAPGVKLASEVALDDVALVRPDGSTRLLAGFDRERREELFLTSGATMPSTRAPAPAEGPVPPAPSTFVNPVIFGAAFDPATVHSGTGSYRLRLAEDGLAEVALSLVPARDLRDAAAITFWARGAKGGERLRVGLEDSLDENIGNAWPASSPRGGARYRIIEGWYELTPEWRRYRIPVSTLPDIDFTKLVRIRFIMGADLGNDVGTTMYVDDIGWD